MRRLNRRRTVKYGVFAWLLTVLVIVAIVIANVTVFFLGSRYEWMYLDMRHSYVYDISDNCRDYVEDYVIKVVDEHNERLASEGKSAEKIKIIFCDEKDNINSEDWRKYVHDSVIELKGMFPDHIEIEYLNIWESPSRAKELGITSTTNIACLFGDKCETVDSKDFYIYSADNPTEASAYNGEKMLASCLMRATQEYSPMCYFTANHGESFSDYEFMRTVVEAGYTVGFLDLALNDVPEDCELLVTFAPKQDLVVNDAVTATNEVSKLDAYMSRGGKYMVFMSPDTFASGDRANFESFLAKWGVRYMHEKGDDGIENCYVVKDSANSITVNGYTIIAKNASRGLGKEIMANAATKNVFGNTTYISFTKDYKDMGNGNFTANVDGRERTASALMVAHSGAEAWAGGRAVARAGENDFVLMSATTELCENGETACLVASASTEFATGGNMSSAIIGNSRTVTGILRYFGRENAPTDLTFKYFESTDIESLTTRNAYIVTAVLAIVPVVICAVSGAVVLIRRRFA